MNALLSFNYIQKIQCVSFNSPLIQMKNSKSKDQLLKYIEEMKEIHHALLLFIEDSGEIDEDFVNFQELKEILTEQKILHHKQKLKTFLLLIINICNNHQRSPVFLNKVERVFEILAKTIQKKFTNEQLFNIFSSNKLILLILFDRRIINVDKSIWEYILKEDKKNQNYYCHFFYPEIQKFWSVEKLNEIHKELSQFDPDYQVSFSEKRKRGENDKYICKLIRNDEVKEFISYANHIKMRLSSTIKPSIYETNSFLIENEPELIEYAAFYGSIQIFQYLLFNRVEIDEKLWLYAIHSNNAELIHLLETIENFKNDQIIEQIYLESIKCHHNNLSEYIENNLLSRYSNDEYNEKINSTILKYHNYLYFPTEIERNITFYYLCKYKYSAIIKLFLRTIKIEDETISVSSQQLIRKLAEENKIHTIYYLLSKQMKIKAKTFNECHNLQKFAIPTNITTIGEYSFNECSSLTEIYIPTSVKIIEQCAFYGCSSLIEIYIPASVKKIESHSFRECSSLQKVIIPSTVKSIGPYAFDRCYKLTNISIPKSVTLIGECAFYECTSLNNISLPSSITTIKSHAFYGCSSLTQINIPISLSQICKGFMKLCTSLPTVTIPSSVRIIESYSFSECSSLTRVSIESSLLTNIGKCAFSKCSLLAQISFANPSSLTSIGNNTFKECLSLTQIEIPSSVKSIGDSSFSGCSSLVKISIPSSIN